jgi:hypothetical protein
MPPYGEVSVRDEVVHLVNRPRSRPTLLPAELFAVLLLLLEVQSAALLPPVLSTRPRSSRMTKHCC